MNDVIITFANGNKRKYPKYTTFYDISKDENNFGDIVGIMVNNKVTSLYDYADSNVSVEYLTINNPNGNRIYAAGLKMLFEYTAKKVYKNNTVEFLYDLPQGMVARINNRNPKEDDISFLEEEMKKIVLENLPIEKMIVKNEEAVKYYNGLHNEIKAKNIQNIVDPTVVLYRMDDLINYYYTEMPYSTGVLKEFKLTLLKGNLIYINYPGIYDNGKINEIVLHDSLIDMYKDSKEWLNTMGTDFIPQINGEVSSGRIWNYIRSSELNFNLEINEAVKYICRNKDIKFVMLAGPSSSGKTTVTERLANYFEIYGKSPIVISIDDYYKDRVDCPKDENGDYDFECMEALDTKYLSKDVKSLLEGKEVMLPKFNFYSGKKEASGRKIKLSENSIVLFEGLHCINDDLIPIIPKDMKYKIYVCPYFSAGLDMHNYISSADLRLLRRIVRDFRTRGYNIESTIKNNCKVRYGEEKYIVPFIPSADRIINTSLPYEVGVLKVMAEPLLYSVPVTSSFYSESRRLLSVLKQFYTINAEYIPEDSIIREFIGGGLSD